MLLDFGWSEILLIGIVALVFIGPKDLPKAMRVAGYWMRKARTLSREFQGSIDQMIREAELDDMRQQLKKAAEFDLEQEFHNTIDPTGSLREGLKPPELPDFSGAESSPMRAIENRAEAVAAGSPTKPAGDGAAAPPAAAAGSAIAATADEPASAAGEPSQVSGDGRPAALAVEILPPAS
jgi:sec-independent protein translocase protein TatB